MVRNFYKELLAWKNLIGEERMPLLVNGARQIGKTYILKEFGKNEYKNTVYLNFERDLALNELFADDISPKSIILKIEKYFNTEIDEVDTLIIFDEIQASNRALTSLKYFCEEMPEIDVVGAGSLLGVHINSEDFSFPVGKVYIKTMYPMNFEEFLLASNMAVFADNIRDAYDNNKPLSDELHNSLLDLYKTYLIVGGMPYVTEQYLKGSGVGIEYSQENIVKTYTSDMSKYSSSSQTTKTIKTYESILPQLGKDNKKFQYKLIERGARSSLFGESIDWLLNAGIVIKSDKVNAGDAPLEMVKDLSSFKLYLNDVGLLSFKARLSWSNINIYDSKFLGGITENYVAVNLLSNNYNLYYWESSGIAEVDFIINKDGFNIPIEVKSGDNTKSRSLRVFMEQYKPKYAIRISTKNFGFKNNIKSIPLYAVYLI